jgi:hypothetical protein
MRPRLTVCGGCAATCVLCQAAASRCNEILGSPDIRFVKLVWWLCDSLPVRFFAFSVLPRLGLLPRLAVNEEIVLTDRSSLRLSSAVGTASAPPSAALLAAGGSGVAAAAAAGAAARGTSVMVVRPNGGAGASGGAAAAAGAVTVTGSSSTPPKINNAHKPIRIRLFSYQPMDWETAARNAQASFSHSTAALAAAASSGSVPRNVFGNTARLPSGAGVALRNPAGRKAGSKGKSSKDGGSAPCIIYTHGGAYLTAFTAADALFLSRFSAMAEAPVLYIDYSLTPENGMSCCAAARARLN